MIEQTTGYNTHEDPRPGECYCHLLNGKRMCQTCLDDFARIDFACVCDFGCACPNPQRKSMSIERAAALGIDLSRRSA